MFSGPWRVPMLGGPWKEKERHPFHLFSFSPSTNFTLNFFFSLILRFYFTMVLNRYLCLSFLFFAL
jgi:hypothetical protein